MERWLRWVLHLHPPAFREAHREEIADFVEGELERVGGGRLWVMARLTMDLLAAGLRLRLRPAPTGRRGNDTRGEGMMTGLGGEMRVVVRGLMRTRGFAAVVVLTLALGVGLNTALFSVVNAVLFEPLGYAEPDELAYLDARLAARDVGITLSGGDLRDLRDGVDAFAALEGVALIRQNLHGAGLPRQVAVGWVSDGLLAMLGTGPVLGRLHAPADPPGTVVISHRLWIDSFGGDEEVLGRTIQLDGYPATVVGVMPTGFELHVPGARATAVDLWKNPDAFWQNGDIWSAQGPEFGLLRLIGRLAPGTGPADAQSGVDRVVAELRTRFPTFENDGLEVRVTGLHDRLVAEARPTLLLLLGAVGLVLLIACANVANLIAVRGRSRVREMALRLALGSPRGRLARLLMLESLTLTAGGLLLGLALAYVVVASIPGLAPAELPFADAVAIDPTVLGYSGLLAVVMTLAVGIMPAVTALRTDPGTALGHGRVLGTGGGRLRDALVVTQVALSLVLLIGAGLLTTSLARLHDVELGFDPQGLYAFGVSIPGSQYGWPEEAGQFYRDVEARVAALPGVSSAGVVWPMPFGGSWSGDHDIVEAEPISLGLVEYRLATEGYFPTAGIPLQDGRHFREGDARHVALVSRSVAEAAWPGREPVGRTLRANPWGGGMEEFEVIGVVGDVRNSDLREEPDGQIYFDARSWSWVDWEVHVLARTEVSATALLPSLRETVAEIDPAVPLAHPDWLDTAYAAQTASTRFVLLLLGVFALTAGALAVIGLYGVVSYTVGMRTREFGVRIALGSGDRAIQAIVLRKGAVLTALGLTLGTAASLGLGNLLETLLFGVTHTDAGTYLQVGAVLTAAALLASWVPAWRAGRVDPVAALQSE